MQRAPGFLGTLFDFSFQRFITLRIVKVLYGLAMIFIIGSGVGLLVSVLIAAVRTNNGLQTMLGVLLALFIIPLLTVLWLMVARVVLESIVVFFRIAENTTDTLYANRALVRASVGGPPPNPASRSGVAQHQQAPTPSDPHQPGPSAHAPAPSGTPHAGEAATPAPPFSPPPSGRDEGDSPTSGSHPLATDPADRD